ncbi:MAG: manganese efflux pump, partial [Clostridia bacterium]|nr:manganese efflux pump [Clostridia bacterium]
MGFEFYLRSALLGVGLAMDACAVSMASGFKEPKMPVKRILLIAAFFGGFQGIMPLIGYFVGYALLSVIIKIIPWLSLIILGFLGGKMIKDGIRGGEEEVKTFTIGALFMQAIATSLDALSVGFTMADYTLTMALVSALVIAAETFIISFAGVEIGKKFGT